MVIYNISAQSVGQDKSETALLKIKLLALSSIYDILVVFCFVNHKDKSHISFLFLHVWEDEGCSKGGGLIGNAIN